MLRRHYNNFVRSSSPSKLTTCIISGEEAKKWYLEEVDNVHGNLKVLSTNEAVNSQKLSQTKHNRKFKDLDVSNLKLFTCVQDNDVDTLKQILDVCPAKLNTRDDYGWSLLMIACQAKSYEAVKELLNRGIDTSVQDKAGNSAHSLTIRHKNSYLANILLKYVSNSPKPKTSKVYAKDIIHEKRNKEKYECETCGSKIFDSKTEHLSSTIHNINASKGRKISTNYVIPQSNKGYQIMLKTGWDKETGLGHDGSGTKYPIKAVQKNDKKGLGHESKRLKCSNDQSLDKKINKHSQSAYDRNRRIEINFRREFY